MRATILTSSKKKAAKARPSRGERLRMNARAMAINGMIVSPALTTSTRTFTESPRRLTRPDYFSSCILDSG
jgi:hypothetical protein